MSPRWRGIFGHRHHLAEHPAELHLVFPIFLAVQYRVVQTVATMYAIHAVMIVPH